MSPTGSKGKATPTGNEIHTESKRKKGLDKNVLNKFPVLRVPVGEEPSLTAYPISFP